jgi:hypothetical protein
VRIPAGCSSAKGPTKTWAPGVGRRRRRSPSRRHERERTPGERQGKAGVNGLFGYGPLEICPTRTYIHICRVGCQFVTGPQVIFGPIRTRGACAKPLFSQKKTTAHAVIFRTVLRATWDPHCPERHQHQ